MRVILPEARLNNLKIPGLGSRRRERNNLKRIFF
jgi:hypothetical protein